MDTVEKKTNERLLIFFDFEVFKHDYLAVFICPQKRWEKVIVNDKEEFKKFYNEHKYDLFVGFNCREYDAWIYRAILYGVEPYLMNKFLISDPNVWNRSKKGNRGADYDRRIREIPFYCYDVYLGLTDKSLKALESNLGLNIHETDVAFDLDRHLTEEEINLTIQYCRDDVLNTIEVFLERYDIFKAYVNLISIYPALHLDDFGRTRAQISATALEARRLNPMPDDEWEFIIPDILKMGRYEEVKEWFFLPENRDYNKSLSVRITDDCYATVAFGGIHDTRTCLNVKNVKLLNADINSFYPNLMRVYKGLLSRACPKPEIYTNMIRDRLAYKKAGNKGMADSLKIPLNSSYGMSKDKHSALYDRLSANSVCVSGQLLLLDLIDKVQDHCELLNINTDGILVKCETDEDIKLVQEIAHEWEERSGMTLEFDEYTTFISRDVNSYLLVDKNGHVKAKGSAKFNDRLDNNMSIINEALRAYFLDGITPEEYVGKCDDIMKYMYTCKLQGDFTTLVHMENGELVTLNGKVARVFASNRKEDGFIARIRETNKQQTLITDFLDGIGEIGAYRKTNGAIQSVNKFANTSEHCFIENGDIRGMKAPEYLDKQFYIDLIWKNIAQWEGRDN